VALVQQPSARGRFADYRRPGGYRVAHDRHHDPVRSGHATLCRQASGV